MYVGRGSSCTSIVPHVVAYYYLYIVTGLRERSVYQVGLGIEQAFFSCRLYDYACASTVPHYHPASSSSPPQQHHHYSSSAITSYAALSVVGCDWCLVWWFPTRLCWWSSLTHHSPPPLNYFAGAHMTGGTGSINYYYYTCKQQHTLVLLLSLLVNVVVQTTWFLQIPTHPSIPYHTTSPRQHYYSRGATKTNR